MTQLDQIILQRKAVRSYDPNFTISKEEIAEIITLASRAPSANNLQPWRVLVIQNKEMQKELRAIGFDQAQIEDSSAIIAIIGDVDAHHNLKKIYDQNVAEGFITQELADAYVKRTVDYSNGLPVEARKQTAFYDAGAFAMLIMLLAKDRGYDTVTMAGFDKDKFAKRFELPENQFPITLIALGKAATPAFGTTRLPVEAFTTFYK